MRTVRDVMRRDIEVLRTTESAADAACFLAARSEESVPLCLSDGSLAGTVSNRDIVAKVIAKGRDPRQVQLAELAEPEDALGSTSTYRWTRLCRSCAVTTGAACPSSRGTASSGW